MDTWRIRLVLDISHSTPDLLYGLGFAVLVLVFILVMILPYGGSREDVPSSFNERLAFGVRVYAAAHLDRLG